MTRITNCCVNNINIVTSGAFQGGKTLDDYYPDLTSRGYWAATDQAGPFDTGSRVGVAVQIIATCTGNRSECGITQCYTIPATTYPGEAVINTPVDDIARSGRDVTSSPFRQDIGTNRLSWADPASYSYNNSTLAHFSAKNVFVSCVESCRECECNWERCCVEWMWEVEVKNGTVVKNTVTANRKWCEKVIS
ncbi:hypothetical protein HYR99_29835 [Candidatus Poribacteria bacterium]|nr:hypothetical protein [Candidatus Poribacteria bacterium]